METSHHTLSELFGQLGLASDNSAIDAFIAKHQIASPEQTLESLTVWNVSQRQFLEEARQDDAAWSEPVDELDALLHQRN